MWFSTIYPTRFDKSSLKRGLCRGGCLNGQSWNWPNHQVARQICPTIAGPRKHEQNCQIFSSIKYFSQSNAFNVKLVSTSDSDTDQILGVPCKYVYFYTCLLSPPPLYKMLKNKRDSQYSILGNSLLFHSHSLSEIHLSVMIIKRWLNMNIQWYFKNNMFGIFFSLFSFLMSIIFSLTADNYFCGVFSPIKFSLSPLPLSFHYKSSSSRSPRGPTRREKFVNKDYHDRHHQERMESSYIAI